MVEEANIDLLRALTAAVAQLALKELRSTEQGAILAFALCVDACLVAEASPVVFLSLRDRIGGLPTDGRVGDLYTVLLAVCLQASCYDPEATEQLIVRLVELRSTASSWN